MSRPVNRLFSSPDSLSRKFSEISREMSCCIASTSESLAVILGTPQLRTISDIHQFCADDQMIALCSSLPDITASHPKLSPYFPRINVFAFEVKDC